MRAIAIAIASSVALWGASANAAPVNDGRWAVRMVTDAGVCDKSYNYVIAVENGGVRYIPQDSDAPPTSRAMCRRAAPSASTSARASPASPRAAASTVRRVRAALEARHPVLRALDGAEARPGSGLALRHDPESGYRFSEKIMLEQRGRAG
jgi:hypothetical protein